MRVIRFRGKRLLDNKFVYGSLVQCLDGSVGIFNGDDFEHNKISAIKKSTIGQFTGLTDKNGKEIYEGDIVKWLHVSRLTTDVMEPPEDYIEQCMDVVVFGAGAFTVEEADYPDMAFLCKDYHYNETDLFTWVCNLDDFPGVTTDDMCICEVIGNIHDNPDLIEKGGEQC